MQVEMKISKRQMRKILESSYDYDQDYVMHPTDYVRGAMSILSPEEFNGIGIEKMMREGEVAAMELRSTWPEDEGFGSSDRTYELQGFLEMLGFKTGFPNGTLEVVREGKMKISKRQLRRIIKEEKAKLLKENKATFNDDGLIDIVQDVAEKLGLIVFVPPEMEEDNEVSDAQQEALEIARELANQLRVIDDLIHATPPKRLR